MGIIQMKKLLILLSLLTPGLCIAMDEGQTGPANEQCPELIDALKDGNVDAVVKYVKTNVDAAVDTAIKEVELFELPAVNKDLVYIEMHTSSLNTMLCIAVQSGGRRNVVDYLLKQGASPSTSSNEWDLSALHTAVAENKRDIAEQLLKDEFEKTGKTSLCVASYFGFADLVNQLLEKHPDAIMWGEPALDSFHVGLENDFQFLERLGFKNPYHTLPLFWAIHGNQGKVVDILVKRMKNKEEQIQANSSTIKALVIWGLLSIPYLQRQFIYRESVNTRNEAMMTPLQLAAHLGNAAMVTRLLNHSAPLTTLSITNSTALEYAVKSRSVEVAKLLLSHCSDLSKHRLNEVHLANIAHDKGLSPEMLEVLVAHGADITKQNKEGDTPVDVLIKIHMNSAFLTFFNFVKEGMPKRERLATIECFLRQGPPLKKSHIFQATLKNTPGLVHLLLREACMRECGKLSQPAYEQVKSFTLTFKRKACSMHMDKNLLPYILSSSIGSAQRVLRGASFSDKHRCTFDDTLRRASSILPKKVLITAMAELCYKRLYNACTMKNEEGLSPYEIAKENHYKELEELFDPSTLRERLPNLIEQWFFRNQEERKQ